MFADSHVVRKTAFYCGKSNVIKFYTNFEILPKYLKIIQSSWSAFASPLVALSA